MSRRYILFAVSLFVNAMGIAFITKALLGTSPITSVTYVFKYVYSAYHWAMDNSSEPFICAFRTPFYDTKRIKG